MLPSDVPGSPVKKAPGTPDIPAKKETGSLSSSASGVRAAAKEQRRRHILDAAIPLFCRQGIDTTSMEELAAAAGIGSATIYRYFPTKAMLLSAAIKHCWEEKISLFLPLLQTPDFLGSSGKEQLDLILELFLKLYAQSPDFLRFLQEFDGYLKAGLLRQDELLEYEQLLQSLKRYATDALEKGLADGTLCFSESTDEVYFAVFHAMLSTTQKLALQGELLAMDRAVPGETQLRLLKRLILSGLST